MTIAVQLCLCKSIFRLLGFSGIINFRLFRHAMKDVLGDIIVYAIYFRQNVVTKLVLVAS